MLTRSVLQKPSTLLIVILFLSSCGGSKNGSSGGGGNDKNAEDTVSTSSKKNTTSPGITAAKFANAVRKRILEKARENDGILHLPDPRDEKDTLKVKLKRVVEASVGKSAADVRYVCAKFKGVENGKDYNIDFFMEGNEPSSLEPARDPILHKVNGEPRYKYVKKGDWKKPKKVEDGT
ncbi:MAG: hypothetical protein ABEH38_04775 [Flavobacteriales bacterium]